MERDGTKSSWSLIEFLLGNGTSPSRIDQWIAAQAERRLTSNCQALSRMPLPAPIHASLRLEGSR